MTSSRQLPVDSFPPTALFLGRFQPFHIGHLEAFSRIREENASVSILIGSSNRSKTPENPLTAEERKDYIRSIVGPDVSISSLPDHPSDAVWASSLLELCGQGAVVYSGNQWVQDVCRQAGIVCRPIVHNVDISATRIREMIVQGDKEYVGFLANPELPPAIFSVLRG